MTAFIVGMPVVTGDLASAITVTVLKRLTRGQLASAVALLGGWLPKEDEVFYVNAMAQLAQVVVTCNV